MTKVEMIEFLKFARDTARQLAVVALNCDSNASADSRELAAQKFHAIICYLEKQ